ESGQIRYYKNGVSFYTSSTSPTYPLLFDVSLLGENAEVSNALISSSLSVIWTDVVNATASGSNLEKIGGCDGCGDSGAVSQQAITSGDGYIQFTVDGTSALYYAGLSSIHSGTSSFEIEF